LLSIVVVVLGLAGLARANDVDDRLAEAGRLEQRIGGLAGERQKLAQAYDEKAAAVASLKAQPSAWGRDRKLQALLAESKDMAAALDKKDDELRAAAAQLAGARKALAEAVDVELAATPAPDADRAALLAHTKAALEPKVARKIKLADETIAASDDAEDLEYKAGALRQSEGALLAEERRLALRASYFRRQAKLAKSRTRADEQDVFHDEEARAPGRTGTPGGKGAATDSAPPQVPGATGVGGTGGPSAEARGLDLAADPSVVLADVVASSTLDELRRAERSGDPESLARSAERATREVSERAAKLHQRRVEMEQRAQKLRGESP
jgi:hypothetical protein